MKIERVRDLCSERHCRLLRYEEGRLALLELQSTEQLLVSMGMSSIKVFRRRVLFGWLAPATLLSFDLLPLGWNECIPLTRIVLSGILVDGALTIITRASSIGEVLEKYGESFSQLLTEEMDRQLMQSQNEATHNCL